LAPRWAWKTTLGSWYFFRAFFSPLFISQRSPNCTDCVHSRLYAPLFLYDWASCIVKFKGNGLLQDILAEQRKLDRKWLEVNVMKRPWLFLSFGLFLDKKYLLQLWYPYEWDVNNLSQRYSDVTKYAKEIWVLRLSASFYCISFESRTIILVLMAGNHDSHGILYATFFSWICVQRKCRPVQTVRICGRWMCMANIWLILLALVVTRLSLDVVAFAFYGRA
jgi:hypothetical protein